MMVVFRHSKFELLSIFGFRHSSFTKLRAMPVTSVREFLRLIEKSSLLSSEQLAEFKTWPEKEPATLVARIVKAGWITEWQSQQLLAGKSQFFMGRYKLLDLIGVGGMGAVFMAMLPPYGRTVALKVMSKQLLKQPKSVTRFLREIRSAAAVDHPNLVRAYDADCDRDTYFLVMEFVSGRNLKSWIKTEKSLPIGWSCECIRQAALGLEHAFEQGMVHRDIKPSNLLVSEDAHDGLPLVKILDLGLARFVSACAAVSA
jgi:serine/threonine-protein kinase